MAVKLEVAQQLMLAEAVVLQAEKVGLEECWQRVLAQEIIADCDFPPFDRSPVDGYALLADEVSQASPDSPVTLTEIESVSAGSVARESIRLGTACRIMTGAPIPLGATGVVRLEDLAVQDRQVQILNGHGAGKNICRRAEEIARGEKVISPGTIINMGVMGMMAMLGQIQPLVYKKPRVALIATGSELVAADAPLTPGKIRNSNSYMLSAQVRDAGAEPVVLGTATDDVAEIAKLLEASEAYDVCITTGGASVGDYDLIGDVFALLGITVMFDRVNMKPGMPVLAGTKDGKLYIGLSGNPSAASIAFEQVVRPVLLKMGGRHNWWRASVQAKLSVSFDKSSGAKRFVWARFWQGEQGLEVEPLRFQGNGMLQSAIHANALIVIPADSPPLVAGAQVETLLLVD